VANNASHIERAVISVVGVIAKKQAIYVTNVAIRIVSFQMKLGYALAAQLWQNVLRALRSKVSTTSKPNYVKRAIEIDVGECFIRRNRSESSARFVERYVSLAYSIE